MNWFKNHQDTLAIISTVIGCMLWLNGHLNGIDRRFGEVDKDLAIIKTVLIMKDICPKELR